MRGFFFAADDGEGVHDVRRFFAGEPVEVEIRRIQFAAELPAARRVPDKWRAAVAQVAREGLRVARGEGELQQRRGVSPEMALRLSRAFGSTPQTWPALQTEVDIWDAMHGRHAPEIEQIQRYEPRELTAV